MQGTRWHQAAISDLILLHAAKECSVINAHKTSKVVLTAP
jgi:hypothetical protein